MAFIRTMRGPARGRSAGLVPTSLACAARRVTLTHEVRLIGDVPPAPVPSAAPGEPCPPSDVPAASRP